MDEDFRVKTLLPYRLLNAHFFGNNNFDTTVLHSITLFPRGKYESILQPSSGCMCLLCKQEL